MNGSTVSRALEYAARNWQVFPCWWPWVGGCACRLGSACENIGKHPIGRLVAHGVHDAATDPDVIRWWWRQFPKANVAIACGPESSFFVLDVDEYKGGLVSLEIMEAAHGTLPTSLRQASGSGHGSFHLLFAYPTDGRRVRSNTNGRLGPGLDVKASGGYIVAAPSRHHSGGTYTWLDEGDSTLEPAPEWLLQLIAVKDEEPVMPVPDELALPEPIAEAYAAEMFSRFAERVGQGDARHVVAVFFFQQLRDAAVPLRVAETWIDVLGSYCASTATTRVITRSEMEKALKWAYERPRRDPPPKLVRFLAPVTAAAR